MNRFNPSFGSMQWLENFGFLAESLIGWDESGYVTTVNRKDAVNIFGLESSFLIGKHFNDLPVSQGIKDALKEVFATQSQEPQEFTSVTTINGRRVRFSTTFHACESGGYLSASITTDNPKGGIPLLLNLFAKATESVAIIDDEGLILESNEFFKQKVDPEAVGMTLSELTLESDDQVIRSALSSAKHKQGTAKFEPMVQNRWYRAVVQCLSPVGAAGKFLLRLDDISEEKLRELEERGKQSLLNDALSRVEEAVFLIHLSGRIVFCNPQAAILFGNRVHSVSELMYVLKGKVFTMDGHKIISPDTMGIFRALEGEKPEKERFLLYTEGEYIGLESVIKNLGSTTREEPYFLWTLRDITADARRIAGLEEDNSEMDDFMRATAHDLRTPVNNLNNLGKLISMTQDPEKVKSLAGEIQRSASNLASLFGSMMELAQFRNDQNKPASDIRFEEILNEIQKLLEPKIREKGILWKEDIQIDTIHCHRTFLRSILYNLLVNAVKYSDPNKDAPQVSISIKPSTNGCWVTIEDNGVGMDLHKVGLDLFQPFNRFTTYESGSGIGLSLVKRFVEKNGGEIQVESTLGKGTSFRVFLRSYDNASTQYNLFNLPTN